MFTESPRRWAIPALFVALFTLANSHQFVAAQQFDTEFTLIPSADVQPGGPTYNVRVGRFEVTNQQYADFLNDALTHLDDERGFFLLIDSATGNVHINSEPLGAIAVDALGTKLFNADRSLAISFDNTTMRFTITPGLEDHPVVGVTWYGAVKYCNWRSVFDGFALSERVYQEAPESQLDGWHPITISDIDWSLRDLNNQERTDLLPLLGYRLPMDGGDGGTSPGPFNEWYKAAAWDQAAGVNRIYGFGRDTISGADANFRCSGDAFEDAVDCILGASSPVGYFNGINMLVDGVTVTNDTSNSYNLYDLSGNVWEWMQDQSFLQSDRRVRGGSFNNSSAALSLFIEAERSGDSEDDATGFRIVQSAPNALLIVPQVGLTASGIWGGPYSPTSATTETYRLTNVTDQTVSYRITSNQSWLILTLDSLDATLPKVLVGTETLSILSNQVVNLTTELDTSCNLVLPVGAQAATLSIQNLDAGTTQQRNAITNLTEPITVEPTAAQNFTISLGDPPPVAIVTLTSLSDTDINWSARFEDTTVPPVGVDWITIAGSTSVNGVSLLAGQTAAVAIEFDTTTLTAGLYTGDLVFTDDCTGTVFRRRVSLDITPPASVSPDALASASGTCFGEFTPPDVSLVVQNQSQEVFHFRVDLQPIPPATVFDWLDITPSQGTLTATDQTLEAIATINSNANLLAPGDYGIRLVFKQLDSPGGLPTGFELFRDFNITVNPDSVTPATGLTLAGPMGGPFLPATSVYTIQNAAVDGLEWTASFDQNWANLAPSAGVIINPTGTADITLTPSAIAETLAPGTYTGTMTIDLGPMCQATRTIQLIVGDQSVALDMVNIPPDDRQPFGPDYLYRLSRFEVTNAEFVLFLNDTLRNAANERGAFMTHNGAAGTVALSGDPQVLLFDASAGGAISFDATRNGGEWVVTPNQSNKPVAGVSWYGAVKFCNWLTLVQNMGLGQRAYVEGATAADWHPVTIAATDYAIRDLNAAERQLLVDNVRGFRLPMDDDSEAASTFNEWYKAAAWLNTESQNAVYGFGRDTLQNSDANYSDSGDPFEPGPTPVGFFGLDGSRLWDDATFGWGFQPPDFFAVLDTDNGYRLYDMTGNVAEWVQDFATVPDQRGLRGGHFGSASASVFMRNDRRSEEQADTISPNIGFRVAQALKPSDLVVTNVGIRLEGTIGGPLLVDQPGAPAIDIQNPGGQTVDRLSIDTAPSWLDVMGTPPAQAPPSATLHVPLSVDLAPTAAALAPAPPGDFVKVPALDIQTGGPNYDFWIGRTEVTNTQFALFLNGALQNAMGSSADARSEHMYFDTDSGSVYLNNQSAGQLGTDAPNVDLITLLYDATLGRISYDGQAYVVEAGLEDHPVVGVTWFGAIKYCNWLTLEEGLPESQRVYLEAPSPNLSQWRPFVASDTTWLPGGFSAADRRSLVRDRLGYRLPMDDEAAAVSAFGEWYKAASYKGLIAGTPTFGALFGFGRDDPLTDADANFFASGDSDTEQTTPVRFFDGSQVLFASVGVCNVASVPQVKTNGTDNGYGLYDMTGNVAEWMQDFGLTVDERSVRGGNWRDAVDSPNLMIASRASQPADLADDKTGFRVVRSTGTLGTVTVTDGVFNTSHTQHFILDVAEPLTVDPRGDANWAWTYGAPPPTLPPLATYTLLNTSNTQMNWKIDVNVAWVDVRLAGSVQIDAKPIQGTIATGATLDVEFLPANSAAALLPGEYTATASFTNKLTAITQLRKIQLTVASAASLSITSTSAGVAGSFSGPPGGPFFVFKGTPAESTQLSLELRNDATIDLSYTLRTDQSWLNLMPTASLAGTLPGTTGSTPIPFFATITTDADTLPVGRHQARVWADLIDPADPTITTSVSQPVILDVRDWLVVTQANEPWNIVGNLDANALPFQQYTLTSNAPNPIEIEICVDQAWLVSDVSQVELFPGDIVDVTVSVTPEALVLADGRNDGHAVFRDLATGAETVRLVRRTVDENLFVTPVTGFSTGGIAGQSIVPLATVYTISSAAQVDVDWETHVEYDNAGEPPWLLVNGLASITGTLAPRTSQSVTLRVDAAQTAAMSAGTHTARLVVTDVANARRFNRDISLSLTVPLFTIAETIVPPVPPQPNGPDYTYAMGTFTTTNAQYVSFLNNALANPTNERGQHVFVDTTTGDVYVNFSVTGDMGTDVGARTVKMFSPAVAGQINFDGNLFAVVTTPLDFSQHPVTGVSWYGAAKFCNWLTLDQGLLPSERCYQEATAFELDRWKPLGVSDTLWAFRDMMDSERADLVQNYRGFRLPMDDGFDNAVGSSDAADGYNEWYKAAAWDPIAGVNRQYGFGRDVLIAAGPSAGKDANYACSGDPFEDVLDCLIGGTTPVGFFGGPNQIASFAANADANAFGLFDLTGNTYEWMQDQPGSAAGSVGFRAVRGGSFSDGPGADTLNTTFRAVAAVSLTSDQVGFRVVRAVQAATLDADGDGDIDAADALQMVLALLGPAQTATPTGISYDTDFDGDVDLADLAELQRLFSGAL